MSRVFEAQLTLGVVAPTFDSCIFENHARSRFATSDLDSPINTEVDGRKKIAHLP
jgi:hypothetical protein